MLEKVAAIIREQLNQENVEITEATRFKEDLEVDSLDLFELVMAFEEEYGVSIPSEELENMATVGDVIRYIQEQAYELHIVGLSSHFYAHIGAGHKVFHPLMSKLMWA